MRSLSKLLLTVLLAASPAFAVITCTASWGILTSNGLSPLPPSELLHPAFSKVEVFSDGTYVATYYLIPAGGKWVITKGRMGTGTNGDGRMGTDAFFASTIGFYNAERSRKMRPASRSASVKQHLHEPDHTRVLNLDAGELCSSHRAFRGHDTKPPNAGTCR